jgi:hypothetical protein
MFGDEEKLVLASKEVESPVALTELTIGILPGQILFAEAVEKRFFALNTHRRLIHSNQALSSVRSRRVCMKGMLCRTQTELLIDESGSVVMGAGSKLFNYENFVSKPMDSS